MPEEAAMTALRDQFKVEYPFEDEGTRFARVGSFQVSIEIADYQWNEARERTELTLHEPRYSVENFNGSPARCATKQEARQSLLDLIDETKQAIALLDAAPEEIDR
jgi:hypothetical protein